MRKNRPEVEELEDQEVYEVETQEAAPLKKVDDTRALTPEIMNLVGSLVEQQVKLDPALRKISERLSLIFESEDELKLMEHKDLLKLWEFTQKQRLQPVETLTKLLQAVASLQQANQMAEKVAKLETIVNSFEDIRKKAEIHDVEPIVNGNAV